MPKGGCYNGTINNREIIIPVVVSPPGFWKDSSGYTDIKPIPVKAIIDTGATHSCITPNVAKTLGIDPVDKVRVTTGDGTSLKPSYRVDMIILLTPLPPLPTKEKVKIDFQEFARVHVMEFFDNDKVGMLLGMDIIMQGSLEVKGNTFTFCL